MPGRHSKQLTEGDVHIQMKKLLCILGLTLLLLCGCQNNGVSDPAPSDNTPPESQQDEPSEPPTDEAAEPQKGSGFPPEPEICGVPFTETESFPLPFEDELYINDRGVMFLSIGQALYDYDTMWQTLEENFPYLEAIKRDLGIDWKPIKAEYRQVLEDSARDGYLSQQMFLITLVDCLGEFQIKGHLYQIDPSERDYRVKMYSDPDYNKYTICPNLLYLITSPKTELFYEKYAELPPINMKYTSTSDSWENFDFSDAQVNTIDESAGVFTAYPEGTPYLRIPSMRNWSEDTYEAVWNFLDEIKDEDNLIIDIRGNGGGSDVVWINGIVAPLIDENSTYEYLMCTKCGTMNLALFPEIDKDAHGVYVYNDNSWQDDFPYIPPKLVGENDTLVRQTDTIHSFHKEEHFDGKIWVLVNSRCYSSADSFVYYCQKTGFATLVGTQTRGNGPGYAPLMMALPYSGMIINYDPCLTFNIDGTCNGTIGTTPDIIPADGVSALRTCLDTIQVNQ